MSERLSRHALVVRLDSMGDMLVSGPAIRAVAASVDRVTVLAGPRGAAAAALLPGVDEVVVWDCPWIAPAPAPSVAGADVQALVARIAALGCDEALVLTSFHQSALPTALLLRLAGVPRIAALSDDYPGSLLDVRIAEPGDAPESQRMLAVAEAAGYRLPRGDDGCPRVRGLPVDPDRPTGRYVVVHPGTDAPARAYPLEYWCELVGALSADGEDVVVTGAPSEREITATVSAAGDPMHVLDLGGRTELPELAAVLRDAAVVVVANTGPAHLAAAVGTPVVSLFAPVVPAQRWAPCGAPRVLLGDQRAACAGSRARECTVAGHPCLSSVHPTDVLAAVELLAPRVPAGVGA